MCAHSGVRISKPQHHQLRAPCLTRLFVLCSDHSAQYPGSFEEFGNSATSRIYKKLPALPPPTPKHNMIARSQWVPSTCYFRGSCLPPLSWPNVKAEQIPWALHFVPASLGGHCLLPPAVEAWFCVSYRLGLRQLPAGAFSRQLQGCSPAAV